MNSDMHGIMELELIDFFISCLFALHFCIVFFCLCYRLVSRHFVIITADSRSIAHLFIIFFYLPTYSLLSPFLPRKEKVGEKQQQRNK